MIKLTISSLSLEEVWDMYVQYMKLNNYAEKTISGKGEHFQQLLKTLPPNILAEDVTQEHIDNFIRIKQSQIRTSSLNSYLRVYSAFFNWAYNNGYSQKLKIAQIKHQKTNKETYTHDELKVLLNKPQMAHTTFAEYRTWVIINFFLATGCRRRTLLELKNKDVVISEDMIYFNSTKGKESQAVPIASSLKPILIEYSAIRKGKPDDYFFCTERGTRIEDHYLSRSISRYNKKRGVQKTSVHAFRHTFAKMAVLDTNMNLFVLQRMLGHKNIKTTQVYVNLFDKELLQENDDFNPLTHFLKENKKNDRIKIN